MKNAMRCLVVGGTGFLGGAIADAGALVGHEVTILSRGAASRSTPWDAEVIRADRCEDLSLLEGREFRWVFNSCAYTPDAAHRLVDAVGSNLRRNAMISSISAQGTFTKPGLTEDDPVPEQMEDDFAVAKSLPSEDRASAFAYGASYGPLKRACEIAAEDVLRDRNGLESRPVGRCRRLHGPFDMVGTTHCEPPPPENRTLT